MTISAYEIDRIRLLPMFSGISADRFSEILGSATLRVFFKRTTVFDQGEPARNFYVVLSGWVKLSRIRPDGTEVVMEIFGPGESFAEGAMHMAEGYPATAQMIEDGRLLAIPTSGLREQMADDTELALSMLSSMAVRLKRFARRIERINSQSAPQRVAEFLLKFSPPRHPGECCTKVKLPYDKQLIANRLGMKPETFSRALGTLKKQGVEIDGGSASIADIAALQRYVTPE